MVWQVGKGLMLTTYGKGTKGTKHNMLSSDLQMAQSLQQQQKIFKSFKF